MWSSAIEVAIKTLEERTEFRIGHVGSVLVVVWITEPTVVALEAFEHHHRALTDVFKHITLLSVIQSATNSPPPEVRARIHLTSAEFQKVRHGSVVVVLARGLAAIFVRTFLAGLALMSKEQMRVAKTLEEAALEIQRLPNQDEVTKLNMNLAASLHQFVFRGPA